MADNKKAVATVNTAMLDKAVASDNGIKSVMDNIHTIKVYNPRIGEPIDESKAWKFKIKLANTWEEVYTDKDIMFNPLNVSYFWSGSVYPVLDNWSFAEEKIFFTTNEFWKYAKKVDTIGLVAKGKVVWFFTKEDFEKMIRTKKLNWQENQFYDRKKDKEWKPFDWTLLNKWAVIYWQFVWWSHDKEIFRLFVNPKHLGVTYKDGQVIEPDAWTFEYAVNQGLEELNEILENNNRKAVRQIEATQVDLKLSIKQTENKNFLPVFDYSWLVAVRWYDNEADIKMIHDLKNEHFTSLFGTMWEKSEILIDTVANNASVNLVQPQLAAPKTSWELTKEDLDAIPDNVDTAVADAEEVFQEDLSSPQF